MAKIVITIVVFVLFTGIVFSLYSNIPVVNVIEISSDSLKELKQHPNEAQQDLDNKYLQGVKLHLDSAIEELNLIHGNRTNITVS